VELDPEFQALLADPAWCHSARGKLIAKYFQAQERLALYEAQGMQVPTDEEIEQEASWQPSEAREQGREARFRIQVVAAYGYTCALTGYRLTTLSGATIVDAAHIHRFADSRNNEVQNGLALCKNAHWMFDNGLWTISDEYRVIVADSAFAEDGPEALCLRPDAGREIRRPHDPQLWPGPEYLSWHRDRTLSQCPSGEGVTDGDDEGETEPGAGEAKPGS
jgi:putative restriction endonuclease